jgi:hypothetical protein
LNLRPSGYEPDELPDCSTPRQLTSNFYHRPSQSVNTKNHALRISAIQVPQWHLCPLSRRSCLRSPDRVDCRVEPCTRFPFREHSTQRHGRATPACQGQFSNPRLLSSQNKRLPERYTSCLRLPLTQARTHRAVDQMRGCCGIAHPVGVTVWPFPVPRFYFQWPTAYFYLLDSNRFREQTSHLWVKYSRRLEVGHNCSYCCCHAAEAGHLKVMGCRSISVLHRQTRPAMRRTPSFSLPCLETSQLPRQGSIYTGLRRQQIV